MCLFYVKIQKKSFKEIFVCNEKVKKMTYLRFNDGKIWTFDRAVKEPQKYPSIYLIEANVTD